MVEVRHFSFRLLSEYFYIEFIYKVFVKLFCHISSKILVVANLKDLINWVTYFCSLKFFLIQSQNHIHFRGFLENKTKILSWFYNKTRFSRYDPHATQFISFSQLSDFIASLDPPLGISKPNVVALVSFNLPIAKGNKIHCLDILHALVKHVLGHVEESDDFRKLQEQMDIKFKKQFPTRKELEIVSSTRIWKRQDKAARLIQRSIREFIAWV